MWSKTAIKGETPRIISRGYRRVRTQIKMNHEINGTQRLEICPECGYKLIIIQNKEHCTYCGFNPSQVESEEIPSSPIPHHILEGKRLAQLNAFLIILLFTFQYVFLIVNPEVAYNMGLGTKTTIIIGGGGIIIYEADHAAVLVSSFFQSIFLYILLLSWNLGIFTIKRLKEENPRIKLKLKLLSVAGVLEDYSLIEIVKNEERRRFIPRVVISYSVEGVQYTTTVIERSYSYFHREGAERFIFEKYIDRGIKVWYDPNNPNNASVESVLKELVE